MKIEKRGNATIVCRSCQEKKEVVDAVDDERSDTEAPEEDEPCSDCRGL